MEESLQRAGTLALKAPIILCCRDEALCSQATGGSVWRGITAWCPCVAGAAAVAADRSMPDHDRPEQGIIVYQVSA